MVSFVVGNTRSGHSLWKKAGRLTMHQRAEWLFGCCHYCEKKRMYLLTGQAHTKIFFAIYILGVIQKLIN